MSNYTFNLDCREVRELIEKDVVLSQVIYCVQECTLETCDNYLEALVRTIIGQQLSIRTAESIWEKVLLLLPNGIETASLMSINAMQYKLCGVSDAKIDYINSLVRAFDISGGNLGDYSFINATDETIIKLLTGIKGIGSWTAEMFLIFSLGRLDIFSSSDTSLRKAMNAIYGSEKKIGDIEYNRISDNWRPYRTIASLFLWKSIM